MIRLTLSCLEISLTRVIWTFDSFKRNLRIDHKFTKYFKKNCGLDLEQPFSFKYFLKNSFVIEISLKQSGGFRRYSHEWVKDKYFRLSLPLVAAGDG